MDEERTYHIALGFRRMVAKAAWMTWKKLPSRTRTWVSLEDLIQEGMIWLVTRGVPGWDRERAKLSTFIHWGIQNLYQDRYVKILGNERRGERQTVSFETLVGRYQEKGLPLTMDAILYRFSGSSDGREVERNCFVVPMVMNIHRDATPGLRVEMGKWFGPTEKFKTTTAKFVMARTEFRGLANREGLGIEDCRHLMTNLECLNQLTKRLGLG